MRQILTVLLCTFLFQAWSQVQINPNIHWKMVRSQDVTLQNNSYYQFEFPAEKGYDYVFNMFYEESNFISSLKIFDMQYKPIHSRIDSTAETNTALEFRVKESGTYILLVSYDSPFKEIPKLETQMSLVRRPEVD